MNQARFQTPNLFMQPAIPHDHLLSSVNSAILALKELRVRVSDCRDALPREELDSIDGLAAQTLESLIQEAEIVHGIATRERDGLIRDRASRLLLLYDLGGLNRKEYHEIATLCNPIIQERHGFSTEMTERLSNPVLWEDILANTFYTFCVAGVFQW